ncbi:RteC domain-containing protein [Viscerimonas tarda]
MSLQNNSNPLSTVQLEKIQWAGSRMELVELVYALHEAGCFGKTPLKTVFKIIGKTFDCEIENYYRLFWDVRNRAAEDRAFFLNKLQKTLSEKFIRMDSGARS